MFDFAKMKRNPEIINSKMTKKGNVLIANNDLQLTFPSRFNDKGFNQYGNSIKLLGLFAIMDTEGNYCVHNIPNRISITPNVIDEVTLSDGSVYTVFTFYKGNTISDNLVMVKDTSFLNSMYNEFITQGKVPAFFNYTDLLTTFKLTLRFNGSNIGKYNAPIQLLVSLIARDINDKSKPYRYSKTTKGMPGEISWVGLSNVHYAVTSTLSKLGGGYASNAMYSAIGNDTELTEMEELLLT